MLSNGHTNPTTVTLAAHARQGLTKSEQNGVTSLPVFSRLLNGVGSRSPLEKVFSEVPVRVSPTPATALSLSPLISRMLVLHSSDHEPSPKIYYLWDQNGTINILICILDFFSFSHLLIIVTYLSLLISVCHAPCWVSCNMNL